MVEVSDVTLMAYADGELDAAARAYIDDLLPARPDLVARIEQFKRTRRDIIGRPFDEVSNEPMPASLVASIRSAPLGGNNVEPFRKPAVTGSVLASRAVPRSAWAFAAMAASIGLMVGGASGWYARAISPGPVPGGTLVSGVRAAGAVQVALETGSSGVARKIQEGDGGARLASVTPVSTFRSKDDRHCRHYQITEGGVRYEGVACRSASGAWDVVYHGKVATKSQSSGYGPAGSSDAIDEIIAGGVLNESEEQKLIKDGWKAAD